MPLKPEAGLAHKASMMIPRRAKRNKPPYLHTADRAELEVEPVLLYTAIMPDVNGFSKVFRLARRAFVMTLNSAEGEPE